MIAWFLACAPTSTTAAISDRKARMEARESRHERRQGGERGEEAPEELLSDEEAGLTDLPIEVQATLERRAKRPPVAPVPRGASVPLFVRPFEGSAPAANWFNHGTKDLEDDHVELAFNGSYIRGKRQHLAYDYMMPVGTPLFAAADGIVVRARDNGPTKKCQSGQDSDHAMQVKLFHPDAPDGNDYLTFYAHMSRIDVKEGQSVKAGQAIGLSGNSGCSKSPHLHFEVLRILDPQKMAGRSVDPYGWSGPGEDPMAGRGNVFLWKPGEAPPLFRGAKGASGNSPVAVNNLRALDALDPLHGEFVQVGHRREGKPTALRGWWVTNLAGDRIELPDVTLKPGETLRLWTGDLPTNGVARRELGEEGGPTQEMGLGRGAPLWNDTGDCARLYDPSGKLVAFLPYGKIEKSVDGCESEPIIELE